MKKRFVLGTACLVLAVQLVSAQSTDLDPVTVTASLNPLKASQTGRNLVVVKGEKFAALPVHSLDELLRYVPGLEVQARGPLGSQSDIVLRGGTFQQVLVIVDGVRVNDPNTGHFSSYIPIAPAEIDRIEILKGASSALYGAEAVGGVVNIITKTFAAGNRQPAWQTAAQFTGGEYELFGVNAGVYSTNGKTSFSGGILSNNTSGQPQRGMRGFVHANTLSASIGHRFTENWNLAFRTAFDNRRFAAQNFYTSFLSDAAAETVKTVWNQLQLTHTHLGNTLRLQAGYKELKDSFAFNPRTATNQNKSKLWQGLVTDELHLSPKTVLTPGIQYLHKIIVSNDRGNHSLNEAAAFLVLNQQLGERFYFSPALRLQWNERAGWEWVPQANLSYRSGAWQLRGSAGKTIRDADFTEQYNNYNKPLVTSGRVGNPDLQAERSWSYEAGTDYFARKSLKISATFFQRFHKNLIDYVITPYSQMPRKENLSPGGNYALAQNIASVKTTGVETDFQYDHSFSDRSGLWANLGFTWLESQTGSGQPSLYLSTHAKYLTNFNLVYHHRLFSASLNGLYKQREAQAAATPAIAHVSADYLVLNAKGEVFLWQKKLSAFLEVDNLTDRDYTDLLGARMPGRWLMGGIKISLASK